MFIKRTGSVTCRTDDNESDGAPSDVNSRVCYRVIDHESEAFGLSGVPGCLQKSHLGATLNR